MQNQPKQRRDGQPPSIDEKAIRPEATQPRFIEKWMRVADWLGSHRPLDLICGAVAIIALISVIGRLLS